ncbi:hypothetical protein D915_001880 [Fasciola hepatica]|uniref:Adenylate kinase n=1 Tax=Fasciola hepatica TaxID=6192 RepID=A0A4E0RNN9_FASHE|nr:hypothetical protein D915_001880 [Fasciola hepatica]
MTTDGNVEMSTVLNANGTLSSRSFLDLNNQMKYDEENNSNTITLPDSKEETTQNTRNVPMFVILGKPSVGKSKLAQRLCEVWRCEYVNATKIIRDNISMKTPLGLKLRDVMKNGFDLDDDTVFKLVIEKLNSDECTENGYILDDFPTYSQKERTILNQLNALLLLKNRVNCFIHIKVPDDKHRLWWEMKRIDPETGDMYELIGSPGERRGQLIPFLISQTYQPRKMAPVKVNLEDRLLIRHEELSQCIDEHFRFHNQVVLPSFETFFENMDGIPLVTLEGCAEHSTLFESTIMALYECSDKTILGSLDLFGEFTEEDANEPDKETRTVNVQRKSKWQRLRERCPCGTPTKG